ncbi:MAG: hypothetical protein U0791_14930 [Gemmataceae bacterium]
MVRLIAEGESASVVAGATSAAAINGLERGKSDPGFAYVIFLLAHTTLAARDADFAGRMASLGVELPEEPGLFDLTSGFAAAVRKWHTEGKIRQTDLGEMAELAAVETLTRCIGDQCGGLFPNGDDIRDAARHFSTRNGFSTLAHEFISRFTQRFLLYHLGRELPLHVGANGRFADPKAQLQFTDDLEIHTREAAVIVKTFAGEWYDKNRFETGITKSQASGFAAHCLTKLGAELAKRGDRDG